MKIILKIIFIDRAGRGGLGAFENRSQLHRNQERPFMRTTLFAFSPCARALPLALALAATLAACDGDKSANSNKDAGTGGKTGTGGTPPGTGGAGSGSGGAAAGTGGAAQGTGGASATGGTTGGSGGSAGGAGGGAPATGGASSGGATAGTSGTAGAGGARTGGAGGTAAGGAGGPGGSAGATVVTDTDIVVARLNADGTLDATFGTGGIQRVDLGPGSGNTRDSLWNVAKDPSDRPVLFGSRKADGATRVDSDRVVVRLTANGPIDTTFATMGVHTLNIGNLSDNARAGFVQVDGKIVATGYTNQPTGVGTQTANRPVIVRLTDSGAPDPTFGAMGIVNYSPFMSTSPTVLWGFAEAYGAAQLSTGAYVTTGYGRSDPALTTVNLISLKLGATGIPDSTYGVGGALEKDIAGDNDRGRNLVVLPDDKILMVGSGSPAAMNVDAMVMMVTAAGAVDTTFNTTGYKLYKFDDRPDEAFFGAAVSPNGMWAAAAGYRSGGTGNNDDATLLLLPLAGTGAEFAAAIPLSTTANDRFWSVAFDANNKAVAAGYVNQGGDNWLAVARFNTDGTPDTTFGMGGVVKLNASVGGTLEEARGLVVLSTGKIIVAGTAEHL
jgi:uncharacterized delta-60 repeat protein